MLRFTCGAAIRSSSSPALFLTGKGHVMHFYLLGLASGVSLEEITGEFPDVTNEQILAFDTIPSEGFVSPGINLKREGHNAQANRIEHIEKPSTRT
jgi:hypothetical protein